MSWLFLAVVLNITAIYLKYNRVTNFIIILQKRLLIWGCINQEKKDPAQSV